MPPMTTVASGRCTSAPVHRHRDEAEGCDQGGHEDGAQSGQRTVDDGLV